MKRLSLEQKISILLKKDITVVSVSFYADKYTAIYTDETYTYVAKSKSISRAMSELCKHIQEAQETKVHPL